MGKAWLGYYFFLNHTLIFKPFHMCSKAAAANMEMQFGTAQLKTVYTKSTGWRKLPEKTI